MPKKKFSNLEIETNQFALDESKYDLSQKLTKEEFTKLWADNPADFVVVNYEDRVKFLKYNEYEVTRENLLADLPATKMPKGFEPGTDR